jgi:hypothetical protein
VKEETFHQYCKAQIARFAGCRAWPNPAEFPEAVTELISTLEFRVSRGSREFAKSVVDTCLESSRFCPAPADLIAIGADIRERESTDPKQGFTGCERCDFSGWIHVDDGGQGTAKPCSCRK